MRLALCIALVVAVAAATDAAATESHPSIYLVTVDRGQLREVMTDVSGEGPPLSISWTPDARALVYGRSACDGCAEIRLRRLGSGSEDLGVVVGEGRAPALSRDGKRLLFIGVDGSLYSKALGGGATRRLIPGGPSAGGINQPRLSPDGRSIAFVREQPTGRWSIDVIPSAGGPERRLTPLGVSAANPAWSPDGKSVAFAGRTANHVWRIELMTASGGGMRMLPGSGGSDSFPTWSPDGTRIAFVRQNGSAGDSIYVAAVAGGRARRLTPARLDAIQPTWSPRGDTIAFVVNRRGDGD